MSTETALDFTRLEEFIDDGRLIRGRWTGEDEQGRETACLLAALYPPCGKNGSASACPATLMRPWLAELTPWIDDKGTEAKWPEQVRRYAAVIRGVVALDAEADRRLRHRVGIVIVREAMSHITTDKAACEQTIAALESGDRDKISAAESAAWSAARSAESAAESAARSAEGAAWSAAGSAARSAACDRIIDGILTEFEKAVSP